MTTRFFIESDGSYVVHVGGVPTSDGYTEVTERPDSSHIWVDGVWVKGSTEEQLIKWRQTARCSRLQGRLTLGAEICSLLDAKANSPETTWEMRESITNATEWVRSSQTITELGYLLGFTDEQIDALFEKAMTVEV